MMNWSKAKLALFWRLLFAIIKKTGKRGESLKVNLATEITEFTESKETLCPLCS